jgi:N-acetylneuraminate synthase/N,N'-diacetyllegionaminate synthase
MSGINIFDNKNCFIIAEAGVNHNGNIELAKKLIDVAIDAGVDAVKFQTFKAEKTISMHTPRATYQEANMPEITESQLEMIKKLELKFEDFKVLKEYCDEKGVIFLSTPFDFESIDILEPLVPAYKIASGELINVPFLKYIAAKGKPMIISTGMANLGEVEEALLAINEVNPNIEKILLHCTTNYPTPFEEVNLNAMLTLKEAFKLPVGYSDHTLGIEIPIAAVAMGARVIEKHFTLDRNLPGPDHKASLEPNELKAMVNAIRNIEKAFGDGIKKPNKSELEIMKVARKSLVAARDIQQEKIIKDSDIEVKRAGEGIQPKFKDIIIGMKINKSIKRDEPFSWSHFKQE